MNRRSFLKFPAAVLFVAPLMPKVLEAVPRVVVFKPRSIGASTLTVTTGQINANTQAGPVFMDSAHVWVHDGTNWVPLNTDITGT